MAHDLNGECHLEIREGHYAQEASDCGDCRSLRCRNACTRSGTDATAQTACCGSRRKTTCGCTHEASRLPLPAPPPLVLASQALVLIHTAEVRSDTLGLLR